MTGAPCKACPCELVTNAVRVIAPPAELIEAGFACKLMAVAASRIVTVVVAASLEPRIAVIVAVPDWLPLLRVDVAVPSLLVVGRSGDNVPRVVVRIIVRPAATGEPSALRAITVILADSCTGMLFGLADRTSVGLVPADSPT
jgi:hypothetical protein